MFGLSVLAVLNCSKEVMILRNAKVLRSPSKSTTLVRNNAHHDSGVSYRDASVEASDVSSVTSRGERVSSGSSSAVCLSPHTTRSRRKWSYDENIELMRCFYLSKRDGTGYRDRLKNLWDSRNPSKSSISVNTLCCHARNIQVSHLLTEYELVNVQTACCESSVEGHNDAVVINDPDVSVPPVCTPESTPFMFPGDDDISQTLQQKLLEVSEMDWEARPCLPRISVTKSVSGIIADINGRLVNILSNCNPTLLQCVNLLYAAASVALDLSARAPTHHSEGSWRRRLESTILRLRRELSRLVAGGYPPCGSGRLLHLLRHLYSKYNIVSLHDFVVVVETLKQKVSSYAARLRKYKTRLLRYWQNLLFRQNEKKFYSELLKATDAANSLAPDLTELEAFWKRIFENPAEANLHSVWLDTIHSQVAAKPVTVETPTISILCLEGCVKRLRNWAAPGPDGIQGFWIKRFPALRPVLLSHFNDMLNGSNIPVWFPTGRTVLIPKASDTTLPKNFRPITCLNVLYKLWTGCITELLLHHCDVNNILHPAQKGCARGQFGCADHLLLNSRIWHQVKSKNRSLSIAWLDYRKAYDSVPHNWILCCLKMFQFHPTILQCIGHLLALWNTTLFLRMPNRDPVKLATVSIRCGIFQGDTLSPLLFCLSLNPLSMLLDSMDGYQVMGGRQMNHMLYMDDLKLFAKSDAQLERLLRTVHMFSHDVCLRFGLDKCAKCSVIRGRVVPSNDVFLPDGSSIHQLNVGETYKYLGLFEAEGIDYTKNKKLVMDSYHHRLRLIWSSLLSGPRKSRETNSFCVPLLSYGFGIIPWTVKEIEQFDVSTQKILTATCNHHPRGAVERLYLP